MPNNLTLLNAMTEKMSYLEKNQKAIANNIANADTPGYKAQELKTPDFKEMLKNTTSNHAIAAQGLATTNEKHISVGGSSGGSTVVTKKHVEKNPYETSPAGNSVVLEEQLLKMNENFTDHRLITNLYQKNIDMLREAVKGGQ